MTAAQFDQEDEVQASAAPAQKQNLLAQFNALPSTTRYAIIGAVVAFLIGVAYFVSSYTGAGSQAGARSAAPTGVDLAPPAPIVLPPGVASALANPVPPSRPSPELPSARDPGDLVVPPGLVAPPGSQPGADPGKPAKGPAPKVDPPKPELPKAEPPKTPTAKPDQPKPAPPPPAPKPGGGDNPY